MKKCFRLFWSYDVLKTERWLHEMSAKGMHLQEINFRTRVFIFAEGAPEELYYRIMYQKAADESLLKSIEAGGWEKTADNGRFYVVKTGDMVGKPVPPYTGIFDKNAGLKYWTGTILLIYSILMVLLCLPGLPFALLALLMSEPGTAQPLTGWEVMLSVLYVSFNLFLILGLVWLIYTYFTLKSSNKILETYCGGRQQINFTLPVETLLPPMVETNLFRAKKAFKKTRLAWTYSPDRVESWLAKMAEQGNILYRMSQMGNGFYFTKAQSRKVKYVVDYRKKRNPEYYLKYQGKGWRLMFTSVVSRMGFAVWSYDYTDSGTEPVFYDSPQEQLQCAKNQMVHFSVSYMIGGAMYIAMLIYYMIFSELRMGWFFAAMYSPIILLYIWCALRTIFYYFRVKKRLEL